MSDKYISRDIRTGRLSLGRASAEKFGAVEGLKTTDRAARILKESAAGRETPEQLRSRIRAEFRSKT